MWQAEPSDIPYVRMEGRETASETASRSGRRGWHLDGNGKLRPPNVVNFYVDER